MQSMTADGGVVEVNCSMLRVASAFVRLVLTIASTTGGVVDGRQVPGPVRLSLCARMPEATSDFLSGDDGTSWALHSEKSGQKAVIINMSNSLWDVHGSLSGVGGDKRGAGPDLRGRSIILTNALVSICPHPCCAVI